MAPDLITYVELHWADYIPIAERANNALSSARWDINVEHLPVGASCDVAVLGHHLKYTLKFKYLNKLQYNGI